LRNFLRLLQNDIGGSINFLKITRTRMDDDDEELDELELDVSFKNKN
jgi:hypothetical protein